MALSDDDLQDSHGTQATRSHDLNNLEFEKYGSALEFANAVELTPRHARIAMIRMSLQACESMPLLSLQNITS